MPEEEKVRKVVETIEKVLGNAKKLGESVRREREQEEE